MTVSLGFLSGQIHFNAGYPNDSELINFYNRISVTNIKSQLGNILTETLKLVEIRGVTDYNNVYHMTINTIPIEVTISSIVTPFSILFVFTAFFIVLCYLAFRRKEMT
jgi:ubiquitin-protein ligase